jgi:hypothetical protein
MSSTLLDAIDPAVLRQELRVATGLSFDVRVWPNRLGVDFGCWEFVPTDTGWQACRKPGWFGGATHFGTGPTAAAAFKAARETEEDAAFLAYGRTVAAQ